MQRPAVDLLEHRVSAAAGGRSRLFVDLQDGGADQVAGPWSSVGVDPDQRGPEGQQPVAVHDHRGLSISVQDHPGVGEQVNALLEAAGVHQLGVPV